MGARTSTAAAAAAAEPPILLAVERPTARDVVEWPDAPEWPDLTTVVNGIDREIRTRPAAQKWCYTLRTPHKALEREASYAWLFRKFVRRRWLTLQPRQDWLRHTTMPATADEFDAGIRWQAVTVCVATDSEAIKATSADMKSIKIAA